MPRLDAQNARTARYFHHSDDCAQTVTYGPRGGAIFPPWHTRAVTGRMARQVREWRCSMTARYSTIYRVRERGEALRLAEMARQHDPYKDHRVRKVDGAYNVLQSVDRRTAAFWNIGRGDA
jgi:hypothetical protein